MVEGDQLGEGLQARFGERFGAAASALACVPVLVLVPAPLLVPVPPPVPVPLLVPVLVSSSMARRVPRSPRIWVTASRLDPSISPRAPLAATGSRSRTRRAAAAWMPMTDT